MVLRIFCCPWLKHSKVATRRRHIHTIYPLALRASIWLKISAITTTMGWSAQPCGIVLGCLIWLTPFVGRICHSAWALPFRATIVRNGVIMHRTSTIELSYIGDTIWIMQDETRSSDGPTRSSRPTSQKLPPSTSLRRFLNCMNPVALLLSGVMVKLLKIDLKQQLTLLWHLFRWEVNVLVYLM